MNNKKFIPYLYLIISFVIIVSAVIVSLTAGLNLGTDLGGGSQLEIKISGNVATKQNINKIKDVLKNNGERYETIFVEDKVVDSVIVVRINDKKIEHKAEIVESLAEKLDVSTENISAFKTINGTVTKKSVLYAGITMVCLLLFVFAAGWIRYGLVAGLSLMFGFLHSLMLSVSLLVVTRISITITALIVMLVATALLVFALVLLLERVRENSKLKHNEKLEPEELVSISQKSVIKPLLFLLTLALVVTVMLICVPIKMVILSALAMLVCLVASAYTYYCVFVPTHTKLLQLKSRIDKIKLSKNNSPAPQKARK